MMMKIQNNNNECFWFLFFFFWRISLDGFIFRLFLFKIHLSNMTFRYNTVILNDSSSTKEKYKFIVISNKNTIVVIWSSRVFYIFRHIILYFCIIFSFFFFVGKYTFLHLMDIAFVLYVSDSFLCFSFFIIIIISVSLEISYVSLYVPSTVWYCFIFIFFCHRHYYYYYSFHLLSATRHWCCIFYSNSFLFFHWFVVVHIKKCEIFVLYCLMENISYRNFNEIKINTLTYMPIYNI